MRAPRVRGVALGLAASFAAGPLVYAVVRLVELRISPEADPAAVLWAEHSAMQTRLMVSAYVSAVLAAGLVALATWRPALAPRLVVVVAALASLATLLVAGLWP